MKINQKGFAVFGEELGFFLEEKLEGFDLLLASEKDKNVSFGHIQVKLGF